MTQSSPSRRNRGPVSPGPSIPPGTPGSTDDAWARAARISVVGLLILVTIAVAREMGDLLLPVSAALVMGSIVGAWSDRLANAGIPPLLGGSALLLLLAGLLYLVARGASAPLSDFIQQAPDVASRISARLSTVLKPLAALQDLADPPPSRGSPGTTVVVRQPSEWASVILSHVTPAAGQALIFVGTLVFFVVGRANLKRRMVLAVGERDKRLATMRILRRIETSLGMYFGTAVLVYASVGVATALVCFVIGLRGAAIWGFLAFLSSFVPYLGAIAMTGALAAGGLLAFDSLVVAPLPALAFLTLHLFTENVVIPAVLGRRMNLNPFVVFVSIVFFAWLWGPVGAIMAVPMLLVGHVVYDELYSEGPIALPE